MSDWIREHALTIGGALAGALVWVTSLAWRASRRLATTEAQIAANATAIAALSRDLRDMEARIDGLGAMVAKIDALETLMREQATRVIRIEDLLLEGRR